MSMNVKAAWWHDQAKVIALAEAMADAGIVERSWQQLMALVEKPWKWDTEWRVWDALGRPGIDDPGTDRVADSAMDAWYQLVRGRWAKPDLQVCSLCRQPLAGSDDQLVQVAAGVALSIAHLWCAADRGYEAASDREMEHGHR